MDYTFKREAKAKSLPFLERYKDKITRVNRFSGLRGALGLSIVPEKKNISRERCLTEINENKISFKKDLRRLKTSQVQDKTGRVEVTVNKFTTST